jgi:type 1 glutamine amidotransferase
VLTEQVLKDIGPKHGLKVTCWRFTGDPDARVKVKAKKDAPEVEMSALEAYSQKFRGPAGVPVEKEHIGRINRETLKEFDCVLFFTTGDPVNKEELADLLDWVKAGGAFCGTHCATDTLYNQPAYGELIGAYFSGHPPKTQKIKVKVDDPKHPAAAAFEDGMEYEDEMYVFREKGSFKVQPYDRSKLNVILSCAPGSFDPKGLTRPDNDYAISWSKEYGKGKVFYTSFGHQPSVWKDERFQKHLVAGMKWAMGTK